MADQEKYDLIVPTIVKSPAGRGHDEEVSRPVALEMQHSEHSHTMHPAPQFSHKYTKPRPRVPGSSVATGFTAGEREFSLLHSVQVGSQAYPVSRTMETGGCFLGG